MIKARFIIEAQIGTPKGEDHKKLIKKVELGLKKHIEEVKQIKGLTVYDEHWEKTEDIEGVLSALVDIGIETKTFEKFFSSILRAAPTAVVMEEPKTIEVKMGEMQNVVNDFVQLFHLFAQANANMMMKSANLQKKANENTIVVGDED
ncbi:MAG: hypothetical protein GOU98_03890 [Candidatus Altiarchaeota archaeon]|nr:hypothetical protein [Candidatus Altiarchaeota archaeon]